MAITKAYLDSIGLLRVDGLTIKAVLSAKDLQSLQGGEEIKSHGGRKQSEVGGRTGPPAFTQALSDLSEW